MSKSGKSMTFLTPTEVAGVLKVHPQTVKGYILDGRLIAVKVGYKTTRISLDDLQRFVESHRGDHYFDAEAASRVLNRIKKAEEED